MTSQPWFGYIDLNQRKARSKKFRASIKDFMTCKLQYITVSGKYSLLNTGFVCVIYLEVVLHSACYDEITTCFVVYP